MDNYLIDVSVLLIFFNRPNVFEKVFEQVKKAKPRRVFLYQDGPRKERPDDLLKINKCRQIAENIDWDCEIHRLYQEKNFGVDPSEFIAINWAFSYVDKCIILEDDDVPSLTFFSFCKEMLDKYEDDQRICRISGLNHLEKYKDNELDYFFTSSGSIWGWASWKRVISEFDPHYSFLDDKIELENMKKNCRDLKVDFKEFIKTCNRHKKTNREHYESIFYSYRIKNKGLTIVPTRNLISNIGLTEDSSHATSDIRRLPKGIRRVFNMRIYEFSSPFNGPDKIENDLVYVKKVNRVMGTSHIIRFYRKIESKIRKLLYGKKK